MFWLDCLQVKRMSPFKVPGRPAMESKNRKPCFAIGCVTVRSAHAWPPSSLCGQPTNLKLNLLLSDSDWSRFELKICWRSLREVSC